jgi:hypothetical protein
MFLEITTSNERRNTYRWKRLDWINTRQ